MRIIDNKKIDLTHDEWDAYVRICKSYETIHRKGEDLFVGLFESDDSGIITFINPPSKRETSLEVFLFIVAIFQHQRMRLMQRQVDDVVNDLKRKIVELDSKLKNV